MVILFLCMNSTGVIIIRIKKMRVGVSSGYFVEDLMKILSEPTLFFHIKYD